MKAYILTVSDTRTAETDTSGERLEQLLAEAGSEIVGKRIVSDDLEDLRNTLYVLTEEDGIDVIFTTGGTGLAPRDNTPEATISVIEREVPGMAEAMRAESMKFTRMAMLSRAVCGVRNNTLIINLPGSPRGVEECFEIIRPVLSHAVDLIAGNTKH
jgi:molybdenum cofactor synthesis domain-containing protein